MVSIIIPNYNYARFLPDCLRSCTEQTHKDIEILVVDDCSTDNSMSVLWDIAVQDKRIKILQLNRNSGYSKAKNEGILASRGEYIVPLDADDMLTHKSVEWRLKTLEENPKIDLAHGYCLKCHNDETYEWCLDNMHTLERHKTILHAQGIMLRKDVFLNHGLFFEELRSKADKEMWYRIGIHKDSPFPKLIKTEFVNKPVAFYRRHPAAMHKMRVADKAYDKQIERQFAERIRVLKKEGITKDNTRFM